jgi:hypothetical protein
MKRNLAPVRTLVRELIPLVGSFAPNGSSAIAGTSRKGLGFSVARTSAGLYTITFTDTQSDLVAFECSLQLATGADSFLQMGTLVNTATPIVQIRNWDISSAAVADIAADANNRIHFVAWMRNSAAKPTFGA